MEASPKFEEEDQVEAEEKPAKEKDRFVEEDLDLPPEIGYRKRKVFVKNELVLGAITEKEIVNEKLIRCDTFAKGEDGPIPRSFKQNSAKEQLMLRHVKKYIAQFAIAYDSELKRKRKLFLCPPNECGVEKFICSTIRPTKLAYLEFYEYDKCAAYVANFITYEPLTNPIDYPFVIASPSNVLKWQKGDCFDLSIVLASLLIGVGYDAYVVIGYAPREITLKIEAYMENPHALEGIVKEKTQEDYAEEIKGKKIVNKYYKEKEPGSKSEWDELKEKEKIEEEKRRKAARNPKNDAMPDSFGLDEFYGKRIHAWVLIKKGLRDLKENLFIEPSTGRVWPESDPGIPYYRVESLFNHKNFWINLDPSVPIEKTKFENMNKGDTDEWEYVTLDTLIFDEKKETEFLDEELEKEVEEDPDLEELGSPKKEKDNANAILDAEIQQIRQLLDMPPPWPPKLYVDKNDFMRGSLLGHTTRFYLKSKVDTFSDYSQIDGMVKRITFYKDFQRTLVKEIRYLFAHRRDNLFLRVRYPFKFKTVEYYQPNNKPIVNNKQKWPNWRKIEEDDRHKKVIDFYPLRNEDGLIRRVDLIGEKTMEYYENRNDRVVYRSVRFVPMTKSATLDQSTFYDSNVKSECLILKLTQKFEKNDSLPANEQIAKMVADMDPKKNRITIHYHMNEGDILPITKVFPRQSMSGLAFGENSEKKEEKYEDQKKLHAIYSMEREAVSGIRTLSSKISKEFHKHKQKVEDNINTFHGTKNHEAAMNQIIQKSLYDQARDKSKDEDGSKKDEAEQQNKYENDLVYPYLVEKNLVGKPVSAQEAGEIKKKIIEKFSERVVARADIISERIKNERAELDRLNKEYQKKGGEAISHANEKNFDEEIHKRKFRHGILDQRLARFEKMVAKKFRELATTLENHKDLQALKNQK